MKISVWETLLLHDDAQLVTDTAQYSAYHVTIGIIRNNPPTVFDVANVCVAAHRHAD